MTRRLGGGRPDAVAADGARRTGAHHAAPQDHLQRPRPLVARTGGSAAHGIYGLILATSVIAVSGQYGLSGTGSVALAVLVTAIVFWLAHAYAYMLGGGVSHGRSPTRSELSRALRQHSSLVEVVIPLVLVLALGAFDVIAERATLTVAMGVGLIELAAAGGYAANQQGAGRGGIVISAAVSLALGLVLVLLKVLVH